jgi:hypothetical protein
MRRFTIVLLLVGLFLTAGTVGTANAAIELQIVISGLDIQLQNGNLFDGSKPLGGRGDSNYGISNATAVQRIDFVLFDNVQGSQVWTDSLLSTDHQLYCDFLMSGIGGIPTNGVPVTTEQSGGFGFDLISTDPNRGRFVMLNFNRVTAECTKKAAGTNLVRFKFDAGSSDGSPVTLVPPQKLPFGLTLYDPISVTITATFTRSSAPATLTAFNATGSATVIDTVKPVPEPACFAVLLGICAIGLEIRARKLRQQRRAKLGA